MMSTDNLSLFAAVQETDPRYTKGFTRSVGFKGTAVSSPSLARCATEQFGPVGIGRGWTIDDEYVNILRARIEAKERESPTKRALTEADPRSRVL